MQDDRSVRFLIGALLGEEIAQADLIPENYALRDEAGVGFMILRRKFIVTLNNADGFPMQMQIELQKPRDAVDMLRYRSYLDRQNGIAPQKEEREGNLPQVTIYFLCFDLPEITSSVKAGQSTIHRPAFT